MPKVNQLSPTGDLCFSGTSTLPANLTSGASVRIRFTKRLLIRTRGTHTFTYEEFITLIARIKAFINSKPLTPITSDFDYLSPGYFLIRRPLLVVPSQTPFDSTVSLTQRWKLFDQCQQAFWRKWSSEYLSTLQERSKWTTAVPNVNINDMVVVIDY